MACKVASKKIAAPVKKTPEGKKVEEEKKKLPFGKKK